MSVNWAGVKPLVSKNTEGQSIIKSQTDRPGSTPKEGKHMQLGTKLGRKNHILKIHMDMQDISTAQENTEGMYTQTKHGKQTTGGNDQWGNQRSCDHIRKMASKQGQEKTQGVGGQQRQNEGRCTSLYKQVIRGL